MGATRHYNGKYSIQCSARSGLPEVSFTLSGHNFSIGPDDYIFEYDGSCISVFFGNDYSRPLAVIGAVFLRRWFSVFDLVRKTISFAEARQ